MRKIQFVNGEYYHIFNRGVEKRDIFVDQNDLDRFFKSMNVFNNIIPIGSIYEASFRGNNSLGNLVSKSEMDLEKLVDFICYCLCPNHYHFILKQLVDNGVAKFMHRLGLGYTNYFNEKYARNGSLFQGTFKANYINSDDYLLYASSYVNLNYKIHQLSDNNKLFKSSWENYIHQNGENFCKKEIVLSHFNEILEYKNFAEKTAQFAKERKELEKIVKLDLETKFPSL